MKKFLTSILTLLLALCCFAGCGLDIQFGPAGQTSSVSYDVEAAAENLISNVRTSNGSTREDYEVPKQFFFDDATYTVTWSVSCEVEGTVAIVVGGEGALTDKVDVNENAATDISYTLTATVTAGDNTTATRTLNRTVLAAPTIVPKAITEAPVADVEYLLYMYQVTRKGDAYMTGEMSGFYFASQSDYKKGAIIKATPVEGKDNAFYLSFVKANVKYYIGVSNGWNATKHNWTNNAVFGTSTTVAEGELATYEWNWDNENQTITATYMARVCEEGEYGTDEDPTNDVTDAKEAAMVVNPTSMTVFLGTDSTYWTFGANPIADIEAADACIGKLVTMVDKSTVKPEKKVEAAKLAVNVTTTYNGAATVELPTNDKVYPEVSITWAIKEGTAAANITLANNVLTIADPAAATTTTLVATLTCGEGEEVATDSVEIVINSLPAPKKCTIAEATAAVDGAIVIVDGTVSTINSAWSEQHGNITVTITDGTNTLYIYRMETNVQLGDIITVTGTMATHNGSRQIAQGATAEITGHDNSYDYAEMTIPQAKEAADDTNVIVSGAVSSIKEHWSSYNNMSVYITDADGNSLYIYRLSTQVNLGDVITVKGSMDTYGEERQVAGGTATITGHDNSYDYVQMTIPEAIAAADGKNVIVSGTVDTVDYNWDASKKNMSVTIKDADGNTLYIYKLTTQVALGDIINVKGSMATYNGRQVVGGIATITGHDDSYDTPAAGDSTGSDNSGDSSDSSSSEEITAPEADTVITYAQATALAAAQEHDTYTTEKYYLIGTVKSISNTQYGNIYIEDEEGNEFYVYGLYSDSTRYDAMQAKPLVGDTIKVYGSLGRYYSTNQMKNAQLAEYTATDANKVTTEKNLLDLATKSAEAVGDVTLNTAATVYANEIVISWTGLSDTTYADLANNVLTIKSLPSKDATVTLTATISLGEVSETKTFTFTIKGQLVITYVSGNVNTADLGTMSKSTSYAERSSTNGWTAAYAATSISNSTTDSLKATNFVILNGRTSQIGSLKSPTLSNGISNLSFKYGFYFGDSQVRLNITIKNADGATVATDTIEKTGMSKGTVYEYSKDFNVTGDFTIELVNGLKTGTDSNKDRLAIWDLQWTDMNAAANLKTAVAVEDAYVQLASDVTLTESLNVAAGVTLDLAGHTLSASADMYSALSVIGDGVTITGNGTIANAGGCGILVGDKVSATGGLTIENVTLTALEGCVVVYGQSNLTITDGTFTSTDNAVIMTNGLEGLGGYNITINGGTFNANITTAGYVAMGIYQANDGTLTVNGGTFNVTNGVGIVCRDGSTTIAADVVINLTQGDVTEGKAGDSTVVLTADSYIVKDFASAYGTPVLTNNTSYNVVEMN